MGAYIGVGLFVADEILVAILAIGQAKEEVPV
jgi:hypothetical protein